MVSLKKQMLSKVLIKHETGSSKLIGISKSGPVNYDHTYGFTFSGRLFENIMTKEEIVQNEQFPLLPQCFPLNSLILQS